MIGAGPAGLFAAKYISERGIQVKVFEEHNKIGYPVHCAGMISVEGFNRLGVKPDPVFHQNTVYGGRVYSSDGSCITIRDTKPRAYIIDRGGFDTYLGERAVDSGVELHLGERVDEIIFKNGIASGLRLAEKKAELEVCIDAEGAGGRLLRRSGLSTGQRGVLNGFNTEVTVDSIEKDMVEVWFDNRIAKDFFTWVIPIDENKVRCGLATSGKNGLESLKFFVRRRFNVEPGIIHGGLVCTGGPVDRTAYPGLMLVGDVAGQVKATTAGGVVIGGLCAEMAGEAAVNMIEKGVPLDAYEAIWRKRLGGELKSMLLLRNLMNKLSDRRVNRVFHAFKEEGLEDKLTSLVQGGDMDMQGAVIRRAMNDPAIMGTLIKSAGRIVLSELLSAFRF